MKQSLSISLFETLEKMVEMLLFYGSPTINTFYLNISCQIKNLDCSLSPPAVGPALTPCLPICWSAGKEAVNQQNDLLGEQEVKTSASSTAFPGTDSFSDGSVTGKGK